jgi:uncharacterized lipoprotein YehR (DUF1307 family)
MNAMRKCQIVSIIFCAALFCGCEDDGPDQDYNGNWSGNTSNGGSVTFTVSSDQVTACVVLQKPA